MRLRLLFTLLGLVFALMLIAQDERLEPLNVEIDVQNLNLQISEVFFDEEQQQFWVEISKSGKTQPYPLASVSEQDWQRMMALTNADATARFAAYEIPEDCCPTDAPIPTVVGILYEGFLHIKASSFNALMRIAENAIVPAGTKPPIVLRQRVQYDIYGGVYGTEIQVERPKSLPEEAVDASLDIVSITPAMELSAVRGMQPVFLATKAPSSIIPSIAKQFDNLECIECAATIAEALKKEGISGEIIQYHTTLNGKKVATPIHSDFAEDGISNTGLHQGVLVDGKVYDNIHIEGIDLKKWINDKHHLGDSYIIETIRKF
ncbi:MAG: papain fold toxin domain-containing protein [Bacteroidota bacterium]